MLKLAFGPRIEHPIHINKCQFCYPKTHYRDMAKNTAQNVTLFALAHLYHARYRLGAIH